MSRFVFFIRNILIFLDYNFIDFRIDQFQTKISVFRVAAFQFQLCAQLRVCSQAGGNPVYPRFSQPDNSESWDDVGNASDKRRQQESRVE